MSLKVSNAFEVASVSPGPAIPTTVIFGFSSTERLTTANASSGFKILAVTPGRFKNR